jgi:hypothetical protein
VGSLLDYNAYKTSIWLRPFYFLGIMDTMSSLCNVASSIDMEIGLVVDEGGLLAFTSYRGLQLF